MQMTAAVLWLILGIFLIAKGGDIFVDSASAIARISGVPKLIVGATVVSFATTLPELLVSVIAAVHGKTDMAVGNAVGSVTANVALIMAIGMIFMPCGLKRAEYLPKSLLMIAAALFIVVFGASGEFSLLACALLPILFALAMADNIRAAVLTLKKSAPKGLSGETSGGIFLVLIKFILGAGMIVWGAELLVDNGSLLAAFIGVPERVIAITAIAVGTSLPELVTTVTAIRKHESELGFGNVIGANIIDLSLIMPVCGLLSGGGLPLSQSTVRIDLPVCLAVCLIALIPALVTRKFSRWQGVVLLGIYAVYILLSCLVWQ